MEIIYHSSFFSGAKIIHGERVLAETGLVSTEFEGTGWMVADCRDLRIKEAGWDICRSPGGVMNGGKTVPELVEVEAYLGAGPALRRATAGKDTEGLPRELLSECVRAVIQADAWLLDYRGFSSARAYEQYWDKMYVNECRYYSNLHRVEGGWFEEISRYQRKRYLFSRFLNCQIGRREDGGISATGNFSDSFHDLGVWLELDASGVVSRCGMDYLRATAPLCFENKMHMLKMVGKNFIKMTKKEVGGLLGGPQGCFHLVDLVHGLSGVVAASLRMRPE